MRWVFSIKLRGISFPLEWVSKVLNVLKELSATGYACFDLKWENFMVNTDKNHRIIDLFMIDFDGQFCKNLSKDSIYNSFMESHPSYPSKLTYISMVITLYLNTIQYKPGTEYGKFSKSIEQPLFQLIRSCELDELEEIRNMIIKKATILILHYYRAYFETVDSLITDVFARADKTITLVS